MSRVILIRHAKSDYPPGIPDHDRPLNARGIRNAEAVGVQLAEVLHASQTPYAAGVSTARRAQQTWDLMSAPLGELQEACSHTWNDRSLYLAESHTLLELAEANSAPTLVIVGHNPGLEEVATMAAGADKARDRASGRMLTEKLPTSSIVVLESPDPWRITEVTVVDFRICR